MGAVKSSQKKHSVDLQQGGLPLIRPLAKGQLRPLSKLLFQPREVRRSKLKERMARLALAVALALVVVCTLVFRSAGFVQVSSLGRAGLIHSRRCGTNTASPCVGWGDRARIRFPGERVSTKDATMMATLLKPNQAVRVVVEPVMPKDIKTIRE